MAFNASGKLSTIFDVYQCLDSDFKNKIDSKIDRNESGSCFYRLLKVSNSPTLIPLIQLLVSKFDTTEEVFKISNAALYMNITLEDVLYLTGLPIRGKPVISSRSRDSTAAYRVFGGLDVTDSNPKKGTNYMSIRKLKAVATNKDANDNHRYKAILLIIIHCFVLPADEGSRMGTIFFQYVDKLDEIDSYAWGAAVLAVLYKEMAKKSNNILRGPSFEDEAVVDEAVMEEAVVDEAVMEEAVVESSGAGSVAEGRPRRTIKEPGYLSQYIRDAPKPKKKAPEPNN